MRVVLCWHMHQPEYRDLRTGAIALPWTYLHATKDYVDMAAHLEAVPTAKAVVNFTPILLEQLEDYTVQIESYLGGHGVIRDPLLAALAEPALPGNPQARLRLMRDCLRANRERMVNRFPPFQRLAVMAEWYETHPENLIYASNQFLADLLVWYHLSWMGETLQRTDPRLRQLRTKACNYSLHERRELLAIIREQLQSIVPRYRALADRGQVELCMSPYAHPIVPLLLELECAREAMPDVHLPLSTHYPGGEERVRWHLREGIASFERSFGRRPLGLWPSEGGGEPGIAGPVRGGGIPLDRQRRHRAAQQPRRAQQVLLPQGLSLRRCAHRLHIPRRWPVGPDRLQLFRLARRGRRGQPAGAHGEHRGGLPRP